ncbi:MAG: disulfide bond formation protein DsbB [Planctomycetota bacterium]|jgi:disulfide bond formation protein DsbB
MRGFFIEIGQRRRYWLAIIVIGLMLEASALYYQYVLDEWPCVLCIHIRIWILGLIVIALFALLVQAWPGLVRLAHGLIFIAMIGLVERSWQVLAVERGWTFGNCDMDAGLPDWFALDRWFPAIFEVKTSCGYTPLIIFNISMAEVLMFLSSVFLLITFTTFSLSWTDKSEN